MIKPYIVIAGESREMTDDEYQQHLKDQVNFAEQQQRLIELQNRKIEIAEKLGLTLDELQLLLS
jgi:hypothetical protein